MPLTAFDKERLLRESGFDPAIHDLDENTGDVFEMLSDSRG